MKKLLLAGLLLADLHTSAVGQAWRNPLPVDSASGYIVYRGRTEWAAA